MRPVAAVLAAVLVVVTARSAVRTLVVPRHRPTLVMSLVERVVRWIFGVLVSRRRRTEQVEHLLAVRGIAVILVALGTWALFLGLGFAGLLWGTGVETVPAALRQAFSSMLTLGFADTPRVGPTIVDFLAALSGLALITLLLSYLPTLYEAFDRREARILLLDDVAGAPAWGPELLVRHQQWGLTDELDSLYADWQEWAADVMKTHATYPVLLDFRSFQHNHSWLLSLVAVLDAAALHIALAPDQAPTRARLLLRLGVRCIHDLGAAAGLDEEQCHPPPGDRSLALPRAEWEEQVRRIAAAGFPMEKDAAAGWPVFCDLRARYETVAYALADKLDMLPTAWTGPRSRLSLDLIETSPLEQDDITSPLWRAHRTSQEP